MQNEAEQRERTHDVTTPPRWRVWSAAALLAAGVVVGATVARVEVAGAQTPAPTAPAPDDGVRAKMKGPRHLGMRGAGIHGEFTTRAPDGGYQRIATQTGEITAVNATSITVRSEDGFSRTYSVDDNTLVNAGNDGIADVARGDTVHVVAVLDGDDARAVRVNDTTQMRRLRERWMPRPGANG